VSHSITSRDLLEVSAVNIAGATAFETSGKFVMASFRIMHHMLWIDGDEFSQLHVAYNTGL
jgi:hypothetical protein